MTMEVAVQVVNAFTDNGTGGNPAGVVLDADRFDSAQKQAIAAQVGLSETAFVSRSHKAGFKLEFFTPMRQIPHCGHATIATFSYLHQLGRVGDGMTSKETIDGNRDIWIEDGMAFMEQRAPAYTELDGPRVEEVLATLGLRPSDLNPGQMPVIVDTGNAFLLVPVRDAGTVRAIRPDQDGIAAVSEAFDLIGYYVFARQPDVAGRAAGARMFAPRYGIPEEAATGMAAGPLACLLHDRFGVGGDTPVLIEQGRWMPHASPSVIEVRLDVREGRIARLMAGGRAQVMDTRRVCI